MDAPTVVAMLSAHLICSGGLLRLLGRRVRGVGGIGTWSNALVLYGISLAMGLAVGLGGASHWAPASNVLTFYALLTLGTGLCRFLDIKRRPGPVMIAVVVAAFAMVQAITHLTWGAQVRIVAHNVVMGLAFLGLAGLAWDAARQRASTEPLRAPLHALAALSALLGGCSLARAGSVAVDGLTVAYRGWMAQAFFVVASVVALLLALILLWMVFLRLGEQLVELATRDPLTRVLNRNGLDDMLARHFSARPAPPLTLLVVDVDHFKAVNDRHGHGTGDEVLREIAAVLTRQLRGSDFVARLGGEEFVVGCSDLDRDAAAQLGERLRAEVAAAPLRASGAARPLNCTVSVGVSPPFAAREGYEAALRDADRALYAAKAAGRNRVERAASYIPSQAVSVFSVSIDGATMPL